MFRISVFIVSFRNNLLIFGEFRTVAKALPTKGGKKISSCFWINHHSFTHFYISEFWNNRELCLHFSSLVEHVKRINILNILDLGSKRKFLLFLRELKSMYLRSVTKTWFQVLICCFASVADIFVGRRPLRWSSFYACTLE